MFVRRGQQDFTQACYNRIVRLQDVVVNKVPDRDDQRQLAYQIWPEGWTKALTNPGLAKYRPAAYILPVQVSGLAQWSEKEKMWKIVKSGMPENPPVVPRRPTPLPQQSSPSL